MKLSGHGSPQATQRSGKTGVCVRGSVSSMLGAIHSSVNLSELRRARQDRSVASNRETDFARDLSSTRPPPLWPDQLHAVRARLSPLWTTPVTTEHQCMHSADPTRSMSLYWHAICIIYCSSQKFKKARNFRSEAEVDEATTEANHRVSENQEPFIPHGVGIDWPTAPVTLPAAWSASSVAGTYVAHDQLDLNGASATFEIVSSPSHLRNSSEGAG